MFGAGQRCSNDSQRSVQGLKYHPSNSKATSKCYPKLVTTFLKKKIFYKLKFIKLPKINIAQNKENPKLFAEEKQNKTERSKSLPYFTVAKTRIPIEIPHKSLRTGAISLLHSI